LVPECMIKLLQTKYTQPKIREVIFKNYDDYKKNKETPSHEEIQFQDKKKLKEIEKNRRALAKEAEQSHQEAVLLLKAAQDKVSQEKIKIDHIKENILQAFKNMKEEAEEEKLLMQILSDGVNLHRVIQESAFVKLVESLGLAFTPTSKSSGGGSVNIPTVQPISFHHWKGDKPGTLDGNVLKSFRDGLKEIGLTKDEFLAVKNKKSLGSH
jgi:hypothetical protein